jgi:iron(III) transport system substrate-binding protein
MRSLLFPILILVVVGALWWLMRPEPEPDVVLYCGVDQDQSRPIAEAFETETGLVLRYQGEIESQRSIGLPQRLLQERDDPRADVFWSNEIMNMFSLQEKGLLGALPAGAADAFPAAWRDPDGQYVAFGARARVLLVNTELLPDEADWPDSVFDLIDPKYGAMDLATCMARPLTGTTYTHAVALLTRDEATARAFLSAVAGNAAAGGQVKLAPSNGSAMSLVRDAANRVAFCLTDTDDAWKAIQDGAPVRVVYPDQGEGEPGTMLIPNTVARVAGGPHPDVAARLLAWIVSRENELRLANGPSAQIPLRTDLLDADLPDHVKRPDVDFRTMRVDWRQVGVNRDRWLDYLTGVFRAAP